MKSDFQVKEDVISELEWAPSVQANQIVVEVEDGRVTLMGKVGTYAARWGAERAAQRVYGVRAMDNEIEVSIDADNNRKDVDIQRAASDVLRWMSELPPNSVKVAVSDGWVTLTGQVDWEYQRQDAESGVRYLLGVTGVSDEIKIRPSVSSTTVKADIEAALTRRAAIDAQGISVTVKGGDVMLGGTARNWSERELAWNAAWATVGVHNVVNNITVVY